MKTFKDQACQGDVFFRRVDKIPASAVVVETKGPVVLAHSETGHNHEFAAGSRVTMYGVNDPLVCYLHVESGGAELVHHRSWSTHESIMFPEGTFEIRRQKERSYTPQGWRRVED